MGYSSKGRKPNEYASKSSHGYIIKDPIVIDFLNKCSMPKRAEDVTFMGDRIIDVEENIINPIKHVIAIDGGYSEVSVRKEFPSVTITFFQFGALIFNISDLDELSNKPFIDPEDIAKLKEMQRFKLVIPTKSISLNTEYSLINSIRSTLHDFFSQDLKGDKFIETLKWFIFKEYSHNEQSSKWNLANCPTCGSSNIELYRKDMSKEYTFSCNYCQEKIYLIDIFRLHEAIDNELGAGGILGYLVTLLEQIVLIHIIRIILKTKSSLLNDTIFIKDGPLAFFGQTANMYRPMRDLVTYLLKYHNLYLVGLEKSGAFVEHADEISKKLKAGQVLLIDNDYIYKYIIPGKADPNNPYGRTTYYGNKLIFKSHDDKIYVATLPTGDTIAFPKKDDFTNIDVILTNVKKLKCDMYDSSLLPISLVNKLVSLAEHPSSIILEKFAKKSLK
jgi:hypothetical protein